MSKIHKNFVNKISQISEKIELDVDKLLLISKVKKSSISAKYIGKVFSLLKSKIVYLRPFSSSLTFTKFCKKNSMY